MKLSLLAPRCFLVRFRTSALAVALAATPLVPGWAGHDRAPDLLCLSRTLAEDAEALRCSFERELRQSRAYPPRGCDRELFTLLSDFSGTTDELVTAVRCGKDLDRIEALLCASRKSLESASREVREVRVNDRTRDLFDDSHQSLCRFSEAFEEVLEELAREERLHRHSHHPRPVIVEEAPVVVQVVRPPSLEEQAVGLIFQAIAIGLSERNGPHCRH